MSIDTLKKAAVMKRRRFIMVALLICGALWLRSGMTGGLEAAARRDKSGPAAAQQQIICEREYINFAFGRAHTGLYVDRKGNVYSYAYKRGDKAWRRSTDGTYTEAELLEKYDHNRKLITTLKRKEVDAKRGLILKASRGTYSERIRRGADQGTYTSVCYLFDAATRRYRELTLRVTGDTRYENLSEEAKTLSAWLDSLAAKMSAGDGR